MRNDPAKSAGIRGGFAAIIAAVFLAALPALACGGAPVGQEVFRHDFRGEIYVFVKYGDELAAFDGAGRPVSARRTADAALRTYAWTQAFDAADVSGAAQVAERVSDLNADVDDVRSATNAVVGVLDELDGIGASIPLMGRVSAMDAVEAAYPGAGALGGAMRELDSKLNDWGADSRSLSDAAAALQLLSISRHPDANEIESAFENADSAARGLADTIGEIETSLAQARDGVSRLEGALRSASETPVIGGAIGSLADEVGGAANEALSSLAASAGNLKGGLTSLSARLSAGSAQAETTLSGYADIWMENPPDASWPPSDPERRSPPRPNPTPRAPASLSLALAGGEPTATPAPATATPTAAPTPPPAPAPAPTARPPTATPFPTATPAPRTDDHGDSPAEATIIFSDSSWTDGDIETPGDVDYFSFWAESGYVYVIATALVTNPDTIIALYDSNWTLISENDDVEDAGLKSSLILHIAETSDTHYIAVGSHERGAGKYTLNLSASPLPDFGALGDALGAAPTATAPATDAPLADVFATAEAMLAEAEATATAADAQAPTPPPAATNAVPAGRLAFVSDRDGNEEIYAVNADGSGLARLTNNPAFDFGPSWSPGARRIAFVSDRDGNAEIYAMNADGSGLARLTDNPAYDFGPSWSPDGRRVAFVSDRDGNAEIYAMNADGSGLARLTDNPAYDFSPSWSPDGRRIAFASDRDGNDEIYAMSADGSGVARLTDNPAFDFSPSWSPDGRRVAFTSDRDGNHDIYAMNADGSGVARLANDAAGNVAPSWSPSGLIAFISFRDGNAEIYAMNADGSGVARLTNNPGSDTSPAWAR